MSRPQHRASTKEMGQYYGVCMTCGWRRLFGKSEAISIEMGNTWKCGCGDGTLPILFSLHKSHDGKQPMIRLIPAFNWMEVSTLEGRLS